MATVLGKARRINRSNAMAEGVLTKPGSPGSLRASPSLDDGGEADEDTIMRLPSRLPDKMIRVQMEVLARKQHVEVLHKVNEVLFETAEFQGDNVELRKAAMAMDVRGVEKIVTKRVDTTDPTQLKHWGLESKMCFS